MSHEVLLYGFKVFFFDPSVYISMGAVGASAPKFFEGVGTSTHNFYQNLRYCFMILQILEKKDLLIRFQAHMVSNS